MVGYQLIHSKLSIFAAWKRLTDLVRAFSGQDFYTVRGDLAYHFRADWTVVTIYFRSQTTSSRRACSYSQVESVRNSSRRDQELD